ncbi:hypothetical protein F5B22DRAFT_614370 [Xylaria bambusicola]|uniref:uncharacterized protein n=1 Tax=Xylaria bambusicola TaxID=326684 RepID=UPI002008E409|nr:uncharacterized protein F5B22DRAFT_614370 [Xylaria bambusicola]KAI0512819.1 hypothetical protein F5B22DRAFT_614370 [Xylaria bambusicola]
MPYKHIAAHLKKTELACRLHYHQLSHGSNRRKRTASVSSGSSSEQSPVLPAINPSIQDSSSRDITPPGSAGSHEPTSPDYSNSIQLPRIMSSNNVSPRLPAILPKPASMTLSTGMTSPALSFPTPLPDSARSLGPSPFPQPSPLGQVPSLRLDCTLPPPSAHVDIPRLQAIYAAHRSSFWGAIASDYGSGVSPIVLEQAWKANMFSGGTQTPITPAPSPNDRDSMYDRTRISAILGTDSHPRSPKEKAVTRRLGEERSSAGVAPAGMPSV